jgi:putative sterol carrier protein
MVAQRIARHVKHGHADKGDAMPKYLSQEWLDEFVKLAADQPERPGATVKIQYKAAGGPDGDVDYYWIINEGKFEDAQLGTVDAADFTMTTAYDDAVKVQKGEMDATAAFMQGKMKVAGNMAKMMSLLPITNSPEWKALQEKVNAITEY